MNIAIENDYQFEMATFAIRETMSVVLVHLTIKHCPLNYCLSV